MKKEIIFEPFNKFLLKFSFSTNLWYLYDKSGNKCNYLFHLSKVESEDNLHFYSFSFLWFSFCFAKLY